MSGLNQRFTKPSDEKSSREFESHILRNEFDKFMNKKIQTINTYNKSADALVSKFEKLGARTSDIKEVFSLFNKKNVKF